MTDRELRQMLEAMRIPMMIADGSGGVLMENMAWVDLRKTLQDGFAAELKNAVLQAESTGTEQILKIKRNLNRILAENTGKDIAVVEADCERDHFMSAQEALEYGLIDKVITKR